MCFFKKKGTHTVFLYDGEKGYRQVVPELPMGEVFVPQENLFTPQGVYSPVE